jgi:hypothetical protein
MLVEIPITKAALGKTLNRMREWLDSQRCETRSFRQFMVAGGIALQIGFSSPIDARAFADQFDGTLTPETEMVVKDRDRR